MPRAVKDTKLDTRAARAKLTVRKEPYWRTLYEGAHLGYRKGKRGGVWMARYRPDGGSYRKTKLGTADDVADADGESVLDFKQAQQAAHAWIAEQERPTKPKAGEATVRDAVESYLADYADRGGKGVKDARTRAEAQILPELGDVKLADLDADTIKQWHRRLAKTPARLRTPQGVGPRYRDESDDPDSVRRRRATANRVLVTLRAALNHAWREGMVNDDTAWRRVKPFRDADSARTRYLSTEEITRLVNACDPPFRYLVQGALFSGARYGELIAMQVADFHADGGTLHVRRSKSGKARHIVLTAEGIQFFEWLVAGRHGSEPLFIRSDGHAWGSGHQQRPLNEAAKRASIDPAPNFHALRHTYASHLAMNGVPLHVIASNLGHADQRMVERHYGHLAPGYVANVIRGAGLGYEVPATEPSNVTPMKQMGPPR